MTESTTMLSPAARVLWRAPNTVQLELGTRRVIVDGVGVPVVRRLLGRSVDPAEGGTAEGGSVHSGPGDTTDLQRTLVEGGFLWPVASSQDDLRRAPPAPRLASELAALSVRHGERAAEVLAVRRHSAVAIHGSGRVGAQLAGLLAAAGVGRVHALERSAVRLHQTAPGGLRPADEGSRYDEAAAAAVLRAAPEVDAAPPPLGDRPDLVVLAIDEPVDPDRRSALHARGCAHLAVSVGPDRGVVGPLVLPGLTSCLGCADLHRRDRDPAWDVLAVQLAHPHRAGAAAQVAVTAVVAGLAAMQALEFLDGGSPAAVEGTLEFAPPDVRVRRRTWPPHPDCDCMDDRDRCR